MKKALTLILSFCIITACGLIFYHSFGWFRGDVVEYIKANYSPDGNEIVSAEYLRGGQDKQGGYRIYQVTTEKGTTHYIRLNVVYHRYVTRIGPDFKIQGITELPPAEVVTQPADTDEARSYYVTGEVIEVYDSSCLLRVTGKDNSSYKEYVIHDIEGGPQYSVGDHLRVEWSGLVLDSLPPQIKGAFSVELVK